MGKNKEIGIKGEVAAENYLLRSGYIVREKNYTFGKFEIDLIAEKDDILVFIEVKTRTSSKFGEPMEAVTSKKIDNILICANEYIHNIKWEKAIRFDIISVQFNPGLKIRHVEDAFF